MTTYYYDNNRGNDSNDGLSPETAWKELTKIATVASTGGDSHLLANDSFWQYDIATKVVLPVSWTGTKENPVIIGKYIVAGTTSSTKPKITWNKEIQANEWTYSAPDNAWVFVAAQNPGNLVYLRLADSWVASRVDGTQLPLASTHGRYSNNGTSLYLWAPSNIDPTTYYGKVVVGPTDTSFFSISTGRGWVKVQDLHFEDSGTAFLVYNNSSTQNGLVVENCSAKLTSVFIRGMGDSATSGANLVIRNCSVTDWGSAIIGIYTPSGTTMESFEVSNNSFHFGMNCYSQGAIYVQADVRNKGLIFGNTISNVNYGTPGKEADGSAIYTEIRSNNVDVYSNFVFDCHVALQDNSGAKSRWFGNLILNCKTAMKCTDESTNNAMHHEFYNNTCIVGADIPQKFGAGDPGTGHRTYKPSGTITKLNVQNNIFINLGAEASAAILTPQVTASSFNYSNNIVYNYTNVAMRQYSLVVESSPNSLITDPKLNSDFTLQLDSPAKNAGILLDNVRSFLQTSFSVPPSCGAFEYFTPRTAATTRTMRS